MKKNLKKEKIYYTKVFGTSYQESEGTFKKLCRPYSNIEKM